MKNVKVLLMLMLLFVLNAHSQQTPTTFLMPAYTSEMDKGEEPILDFRKTVGTINGEYGVNDNGAAVYSIPILIPPGSGGMIPTVGIQYNSQSGDGWLGKGWTVSGFSSITRMPKTFYLDNKVEGLKFDNTDHFVLDGNVLIPISGNNGENGTEYRTEVETFSQIISYCTSGSNEPDYFVVHTKDGKIIQYGNTIDSRQMLPGSTKNTLAWHASKISDANTNFIVFSYTNENSIGRFKPCEIKYTGNDIELQHPYNTIHFFYKNDYPNDNTDLPKDRISYIYGTKLSQIEILDRIEIKNNKDENWELVRRYTFAYYNSDANDFKTLLKSITEWDSKAPDAANSDDSYNSTIFNYTSRGSYQYGYLTSLYYYAPNSSSGDFHEENPRYLADVNGDGRDDIVGFGDQNVLVSLSNGSNFDGPVSWLTNGFCVNNSSGGWHQIIEDGDYIDEYNHPRRIVDLNGDGMADIIGFGYNGTVVALSNGNSFNISSSLAFFDVVNDFDNDVKNPRFLADVNGDKLPDIIGFRNSEIWVSLNNALNPGSFLAPTIWIVNSMVSFVWNADVETHIRTVADVNGDGLADIVVFGHYGVYVYLSNGSNQFIVAPTGNTTGEWIAYFGLNSGYNGWDPKKNPRMMADVNGDGMADIVGFADSDVKVALSNGKDGFILQTLPWSTLFCDNTGWSNNTNFPRYLADVNGDGLPDIVGFGHGDVAIGLNTGHSFIAASANLPTFGTDNFGTTADHIRTTADVNGDGRADIIGFAHDAVTAFVSQLDDDRKINKITNGLGFRVNYSYKPILDNSSVYQKIGLETYPFLKIAGSLNVTNTLSVENGVGGFNTTTYFYKGATAHLKGKGFLGFQEIYSYNTNPVKNTGKFFTIDHNRCFKNPLSTRTYINGTPAYESFYSFKTYPNQINNLIYSQGLCSTTSFDYILKNKLTKEFCFEEKPPAINYPGYDDWGNPQTIRTKSYDITSGNDVEELSQLEEITYCSAGTFNSGGNNWCLNKPETIRTTKHTTPTEPDYIREKKYTYNTKGNLTSEITDPGDDKSTKVEYDYINTITNTPDNFGNPWKKILKAPNATTPPLPDIINGYEYDTKGRFVTKKINPLGHTVSNEYDPKFGNITHTIDENNIITDYEYDLFGSLKKIINTTEGGTYTEFGCNWIMNPVQTTPAFALYQTVSTTSCEPQSPSITTYDKLTRELQTENANINGEKILANKEYNDRGGIATASLPFFEGAAIPSTIFLYDVYGRKTLQTNPDNSTVSIYYNSKETTITTQKNGNSQQQVNKVNSLNQTIQTIDNIGTEVNNTYFSSGLLKNTMLGADQYTVTSFTYDLQGNRLSITEPNSGPTTTVYNAYGQVTMQWDANHYITNMEYDKLGRIIKKEINEGHIDYVYDLIPGSTQTPDGYYGKISSVTAHWNDGTVITDEFMYDFWGRETTSRESITGNGNDKHYEEVKGYDDENDCGRLKTLTYPDGFAIEYEYQNGQLKALNKVDAVNGNTLIWRTETEDNLGNTTQFALGNGAVTSKSFENTTGRLLEINTSINNTPTPVPIQAWQYKYDDFGNIRSRADNIPTSPNGTTQREKFEYDQLNRLISINNLKSNTDYNINFDPYGNITRKFNAGDYKYYPPQINAVKLIENNPDNTINTDHILKYTTFNKVSYIDEGRGHFYIDLTYGPDFSRRKTYYYDNNNQTVSKYFAFGNYEEEENTNAGEITKDYYIYAGDGLAAIYRKINDNITGSMYYIHTDVLGSFDRVTNEAGDLADQYSFDAWGNRRDVNDWEQPDPNATPHLFARGYTGHEHLDKFGLINMNGRMYDPILGRFLSPDNYVQAPDNTQNFNRYSYCLNNPMKYTDPSGEFIFSALIPGIGILIDAACWSALADATIQGVKIAAGAQTTFNFAELGGAAIGGAVFAGMGMAAPAFTNSNLLLRYAGKAAYAGLSGGVSATSGLFAQDLFDNGKIDFTGSQYASAFAMGFGISAGISALSSAYNYSTWDRFTAEEKIAKLQGKGMDVKLGDGRTNTINGKTYDVYGYREGNNAFINPYGLDNLSYNEIKYTYLHELKHIQNAANVSRVYQAYGENAATYYSEITAYRYDLSVSKFASWNYRNAAYSNMKFYEKALLGLGLNPGKSMRNPSNILNLFFNLY